MRIRRFKFYPVATAKWKAKYPERNLAHKAVNRAIAAGSLIRPEHCENCGLVCRPQAHHQDYRLLFKVRWLCALCHKTEHRLSVTDAGKGPDAT